MLAENITENRALKNPAQLAKPLIISDTVRVRIRLSDR